MPASRRTGDNLLAFTDGTIAAKDLNNTEFALKGVYRALQGEVSSARAMGEQVLGAVKKFSPDRSRQDDMTLIAFGRTW